jgi:hypothetical protein
MKVTGKQVFNLLDTECLLYFINNSDCCINEVNDALNEKCMTGKLNDRDFFLCTKCWKRFLNSTYKLKDGGVLERIKSE